MFQESRSIRELEIDIGISTDQKTQRLKGNHVPIRWHAVAIQSIHVNPAIDESNNTLWIFEDRQVEQKRIFQVWMPVNIVEVLESIKEFLGGCGMRDESIEDRCLPDQFGVYVIFK